MFLLTAGHMMLPFSCIVSIISVHFWVWSDRQRRVIYAEGQQSDVKLQRVKREQSALTRWGFNAATANLHEATHLTVSLQEAAPDLHLLTRGGCRVCEREAGPSVALLDPHAFHAPDQNQSAGSCMWSVTSIKQAVWQYGMSAIWTVGWRIHVLWCF